MSAKITVEQIEPIQKLGPDFIMAWKDILISNHCEIPFSDPDWLAIWWKYYGVGFEQLILAVKLDNKLVGVFPLVIKHKFIYKQVSFMGYPQATHMEMAINQEFIKDAFSAILHYLNHLDGNILYNFSGFKESSNTTTTLINQIKDSAHPYLASKTMCPVIHADLKNYSTLYQGRFSSHNKNRDRRNERRLSLLGHVDFKELTKSDMMKAFELHNLRWKKKLDTSGFTSSESINFYSYLLTYKSDRWQSLTLGLYLNKELLAFEYGYLCGGQAILYRSAHNTIFNIFALGKITHRELIRRCFDRGLHSINLGIGYEKHKMEWTDHHDIIISLAFPKCNLMSCFIFIFYFIKGSIKNRLKQNRKVVLFKRNTLGELKYFFSLEHLIYFSRKFLSAIQKQGIIKYFLSRLATRKYMKYQFDLMESILYHSEMHSEVQAATVEDAQELGHLMNCDPEIVIRRFYKLEQCYIIKVNQSIVSLAWVTSDNRNPLIYDCYQDRRLCSLHIVYKTLLDILTFLQRQKSQVVTLLVDKSNKKVNQAAIMAGFKYISDEKYRKGKII